MRIGNRRSGLCIRAVLAIALWTIAMGHGTAGEYVFTVRGEDTLLNGQKFLVKGLRCSNALISDATADDLIAHLDEFTSHGVNTVSVFFMGSRFGDVKGYREDATLDPAYAARMGRIIEAADRRGMVVLVGCLYWSTSKAKWEAWTQSEADAAVANTVRWLKDHDYRNVFIDVDNEGMARKAKGFDNRSMVRAGKAVDPACVIGTNFKSEPPPEADLALHFATPVSGKPYIQSEGAPPEYWGEYSKRKDLYQYVNVGVYTDEQKRQLETMTDEHLRHNRGFIMASTWLQSIPPLGPNMSPGGDGDAKDPGIRWWLEYLRKHYGAERSR